MDARENEDQNQDLNVAANSQVGFAEKSPSIIPSPIYDDSSSMVSSSYTTSTSKVTTTTTTSKKVVSTSDTSLTSTTNNETVSINKSANKESSLYNAKVEIDENKSNTDTSYGPTFKEEDITMQETIYLTETFTDNSSAHNIKTSESRHSLDTLFSRIRGRRASNATTLVDEEKGKTMLSSSKQESVSNRGVFKERGLVYRQLFGNARYPVLTWIFILAMVSFFIYELVRNEQLTGGAIQTDPFNPMIGPNYVSLITMRSKFIPCMRNIPQYPPSYILGNCYSLNATCTIETACGGFNGAVPNQTSRFIEAMFVHAGVVHLFLNVVAQINMAPHIERTLGSIRFTILYIGSGVWGFILSATLSGSLSSSMGCSGALFGLLGYQLVETVIRWKDVRRPWSQFIKLNILVLISLAIGLLPGLDNFAHIGGLVMGILLSTVLSPRRPVPSRTTTICTWVSRVVAFTLFLALYIVFLSIFFTAEDLDNICPNCKYLSCIPSSGWCDLK